MSLSADYVRAKYRVPDSWNESSSTITGRNCDVSRSFATFINAYATCGKDPTDSCTCSRPRMTAPYYGSSQQVGRSTAVNVTGSPTTKLERLKTSGSWNSRPGFRAPE